MPNAHTRYWQLACIMLVLSHVAGCTAEAQRYIRFPNFSSPGPAPIQRAEAVQHDPYPLNDLGPEIVGGRPLSYQQSLTETERAKLVPTQPVLIQGSAPPGSAVVAPPVISSPIAVAPPQPGAVLAPAGSAGASAMVLPGPPIRTSPLPGSSLPAPPVYAPPAPLVTSPIPAVAAPAVGAFPSQRRPSY
jgi:hypothetical protein